MDYKKICRTLSVSTVCAGILFTSTNNVYANVQKIREGIILETIGNENKINNPSQNSKQPLTWGTFIREMSRASGEGEDQIIKILKESNELHLPLVMTKTQVSHNYKTLLEFKNQGKLDSRNYLNIVNRVQAISPIRNYITNEEMDTLAKEFSNYSIFNGVIREEMKGKLVEFKNNERVVFDIITLSGVQRREFTLNPRTTWKIHNGMYRLMAEGDSLVVIEGSDAFKYGIVKTSDKGLIVDNQLINANSKRVLVGDYVEYAQESGKLVSVLNNLGKPKYRVVKDISRDGTVSTFNGSIDLRDYDIVTDTGLPTNFKSIKPFDLISLAGDTAVVTTTTKRVDMKLIGNTIVIEGIAYSSDDLVLTDGIFVNDAQDWKYRGIITQGEVITDLEGNPRVVKIEQMENPGIAIGIGTDEVRVISIGETEYDLNPVMRTRINLDKIYNFIILDGEIVEAERGSTITGRVSTLPKNFIQISRKKYVVNSNTPVVIKREKRDDSDNYRYNKDRDKNRDRMSETKYEYESIFYDDLLDIYKEEIGGGDMDLEILEIYNQVGMIQVEFNPSYYLSKDNHLDNVNEYKIESIGEFTRDKTLITVSDGSNQATLSYEGKVRYKPGDMVKLQFSRKGELIRIY